MRLTTFLLLAVFLSGCAFLASRGLDEQFGEASVQNRNVSANSEWGLRYHEQVKPVLENRCTVCHGCYDAPCQLKLSSLQGIDRGASQSAVYDGERLIESSLSRLFIDGESTEDWRQQAFFPVLNERQQSPAANREAGLLYQMLELKKRHPLPSGPLLSDSFTIDIGRENQCPKIEEFQEYA